MSRATFTVIGCSDAFSCGGRGNACFFLRTDGAGILIDCGASALGGIKKHGLSTDDIDLIVLSHFHGDHYGGLPFVVFDAARQARGKPLTIVSPPGGREKLEAVFGLFYPGSEKALAGIPLQYKTYSGRDRLKLGGIEIETFPVTHTRESLPHGLRIGAGGITISYTGDTEWSPMLPELMAGADLAVCDCTFYEQEKSGHMNYATLKEHLPELSCKRLLLTHFDDEMLQHLDDVGPECAYDGMRILL